MLIFEVRTLDMCLSSALVNNAEHWRLVNHVCVKDGHVPIDAAGSLSVRLRDDRCDAMRENERKQARLSRIDVRGREKSRCSWASIDYC